jgi:hypothetical protein
MKKIDLFKDYCLLKGLLDKFGYPFLDENGILAVKTLSGKVYSGTEIAYQHSSRFYEDRAGTPHFYYKYVDQLVSVSQATCGHVVMCQVGKHNKNCDGGMYSPNKCAVVFLDGKKDILEDYRYSLTYEDLIELSLLKEKSL